MIMVTTTERELTYRVVDAADRGTYSRIKYAGKEADGDSIAARNQKRYDAALQMKQAWLSRLDPTLNLEIIACDIWGTPLDEPKPAPKPAPKRPRRRTYQ